MFQYGARGHVVLLVLIDYYDKLHIFITNVVLDLLIAQISNIRVST